MGKTILTITAIVVTAWVVSQISLFQVMIGIGISGTALYYCLRGRPPRSQRFGNYSLEDRARMNIATRMHMGMDYQDELRQLPRSDRRRVETEAHQYLRDMEEGW